MQPLKNKSTSSSNHPNTAGTSHRCFNCQGFGHIAFDCPNRKIVSLVEGDVEIEDEDDSALVVYEPVVYDEEVVFADQGEMLVIQRSLKVAHAEDE